MSAGECLAELRTVTGRRRHAHVEVVPDVVGVAEAAEIMGWDKRRVVTYIDRGSFPEPITALASGRIWLREDVQAYADGWRARRAATARRTGSTSHVSDRRLYLIRHGRPDYSSTAHADAARPPVRPAPGRDRHRAVRASGRPAPAAAASGRDLLVDAGRARETARVVRRPRRHARDRADDLCEWFGGEWEAKDFEQIFEEHPEAIDLFRNQNPAWHLGPGSERPTTSSAGASTRSSRSSTPSPKGDVVVVAHGGVINAYFSHILGIAGQDMFFLPENTSLNTVVIRGDERLAWFLSDASHLTDPGWFELREWERDLAEGR